MKNVLLILILSGVILSCSKDDEKQNNLNPQLFGKWKLIETYQDPGDGSGVYESINSEKTIEIFDNGTFIINGPLCGLSVVIGQNIAGNVSTSAYTTDNVLNSNEQCELNNSFSEYIINIENSHLIINWTACIEGCGLKFQKLQAE